ncbi:MAG: 30S ribosomal protein S16 [Candidatus Latescibacteria bacterium]|nr:30S ribosomal protein S16 [Candidatus Latescibacterota bacterium]
MGRTKRPFYRLVAVKADAPRDGQTLAQMGTYDPLYAKVNIDEAAALLWLKRGAQMTATVQTLFKSQGILARLQGLEGKVREHALTREKPARRRKLKGQPPPPEGETQV